MSLIIFHWNRSRSLLAFIPAHTFLCLNNPSTSIYCRRNFLNESCHLVTCDVFSGPIINGIVLFVLVRLQQNIKGV